MFLIRFWKKYAYLILMLIIIGGLFDKRLGLIAIICIIAPIILSFFIKGRFWCKYLCPRGSFLDNIIFKLSSNKPTPRILKSTLFRILVIISVVYLFSKGLKMVDNEEDLGVLLYSLVVDTTLIAVLMSIFFNHRTWCSFCPIGSISNFISYTKKR